MVSHLTILTLESERTEKKKKIFLKQKKVIKTISKPNHSIKPTRTIHLIMLNPQVSSMNQKPKEAM